LGMDAVAFRWSGEHRHPELGYTAQYLACTLAGQRFASVLADRRA
jgi:hypothetical protein